MKQRTFFFKVTLALCMVVTTIQAQNLITNGSFSSGLSTWQYSPGGCVGGGALGVMTGSPDYITTPNNGHPNWADLTGCGWGNGRWIKQRVPTTVGKTYLLQWDLGCPNDARKIDAGVDLALNSVTVLPRFAHADFSANPTGNDYCAWKRFNYCFTATQSNTEIKFTANAAGTSSTPGWANTNGSMSGLAYEHPRVIGFDNVEMICIDDLFQLNATPGTGCNQFCLSLAMQTNSLVTYSNVKWYINNVMESNSNSYCRYFPQNQARQVKVDFTITTPCGTSTRTLQKEINATANCPCNLQSHVSLGYVVMGCTNGIFSLMTDPGYAVHYAQWTLDGASASGNNDGISLFNLSPGQHTICATVMGGIEGEADNICCAKVCQVITILPEQYAPEETVYTSCTSLLTNFQYTVNCGSTYTISGTGGNFSGPSPAVVSLPPGDYTVKCLDPVSCVTTIKTLHVIQKIMITESMPDETVSIPCGSNAVVYNPHCGPIFEISGPGGFFISSTTIIMYPQLSAGDYTVRCIDPVNCRTYVKIVHVVQTPMTIIPYAATVLHLPCGSNGATYNPACTTSYTIVGSNGFTMQDSYPFIAMPVLPLGSYTVHCADYENCLLYETTVDVREPLITESSCNVFIEVCDFNFDPNQSWYFVNQMTDCPECQATVRNATSVGPFITQSYVPVSSHGGAARIVTCEYYDAVNCRKCTVTFNIANADWGKEIYYMQAGKTCQEVTLPDCLANSTVKMFVNGHSDNAINQITGATIELCCDNPYGITNPVYVLYSETNPCCFKIIELICSPSTVERSLPASLNTASGTKATQGLTLVPNPTSSVFRIVSGEQDVQFEQVEITDLNGKVVLTRTNINSDTDIDAGKLAKGIYMVNVTMATGRTSLKLALVNE
jgi:hypothetical protein